MEAEVLPLVTGLVTAHDIERAAVIAELGDLVGRHRRRSYCFQSGVDLEVQYRGFDGTDALETSLGSDHAFDKGFFERGARLEFVEEFFGEGEEFVPEFELEVRMSEECRDGWRCNEPMRSALTVLRIRAVGTVRLTLFFGSHDRFLSRRWKGAVEFGEFFVDFKEN